MSAIAFAWSGVSGKGKRATKRSKLRAGGTSFGAAAASRSAASRTRPSRALADLRLERGPPLRPGLAFQPVEADRVGIGAVAPDPVEVLDRLQELRLAGELEPRLLAGALDGVEAPQRAQAVIEVHDRVAEAELRVGDGQRVGRGLRGFRPGAAAEKVGGGDHDGAARRIDEPRVEVEAERREAAGRQAQRRPPILRRLGPAAQGPLGDPREGARVPAGRGGEHDPASAGPVLQEGAERAGRVGVEREARHLRRLVRPGRDLVGFRAASSSAHSSRPR